MIPEVELFGYSSPTPRQYWLDAQVNLGIADYDTPIGNIYAVARASGGSGGGDNFWSAGIYSAGN